MYRTFENRHVLTTTHAYNKMTTQHTIISIQYTPPSLVNGVTTEIFLELVFLALGNVVTVRKQRAVIVIRFRSDQMLSSREEIQEILEMTQRVSH